MSKRYYIAYGSNLYTEQMRQRCPDAELIGTSVLPDYRLLYKGKWNESWLTIEHSAGSQVPVAIWLVSRRDEMMMDRYEGYPILYYKADLVLPVVDCGDSLLENVPAFVYIIQSDNEPAIPSAEYVEECVEGYRRFGFDTELLREAMRETIRLVGEV